MIHIFTKANDLIIVRIPDITHIYIHKRYASLNAHNDKNNNNGYAFVS